MRSVVVDRDSVKARDFVHAMQKELDRNSKTMPELVIVVLPGQKDTPVVDAVWRAVKHWCHTNGIACQCFCEGNKHILAIHTNVLIQGMNKLGLETRLVEDIGLAFPQLKKEETAAGAGAGAGKPEVMDNVMVCGLAVEKNIVAFTFTTTQEFNKPVR